MTHPFRLFAILLCALVLPASAMWSDVSPSDSLWRLASQAKLFLVRTGDARLDDGIEQGFAEAWPSGRWSWVPDSGIADLVKDSTVLLFRLVEPRSPAIPRGSHDCASFPEGGLKVLCFDEQARGRFHLEIGGKRLKFRSGTRLLEMPSQARRMPMGDAYVIDLAKDVSSTIRIALDSLYPSGSTFSGSRYWAREALVRDRRERLKRDTLFVVEEQVGAGGVAPLAAAIGGSVVAVPAATLESMLGTSRQGLHLEAGILPASKRLLRVRDIATGDPVLFDDGPAAYGRKDTLLRVEDFQRLAHRAAGDEQRNYLMGSIGPELSFAGLMGLVYTAGYEFRRGLWATAGWARWSGRPEGSESFRRDHVLLGIRYTPIMSWETPGLGSLGWWPRVSIGARYWQPYGSSDSTDTDEWLHEVYPHVSLDGDLLWDFLYLGASPEVWFGTNTVRKYRYEGQGASTVRVARFSDHHEGGWSFRLGFQMGLSGWRPGVEWVSAKEKAARTKR
jgi:hypothetical protein